MKKLFHCHFPNLTCYVNQIRSKFLVIGFLFFSLSLQAQVDLYIKNVKVSPSSVASGDEISISSTLTNGGSGYVSYAYTGYYLSSDTIFTKEDAFINSGSSYLYGSDYTSQYLNLTIPSSTKPGKYYVILVADYSNYLNETNELNNVASAAITVSQPLIDLSVSGIKLSNAFLSPGAYISLTNTLQNKGTTSSGYSYTGYYLSSDTILDINVDLLMNYYSDSYSVAGNSAIEQSASFYLPKTVGVGPMYLIAKADYSSRISETNEDNNTSYVSITISKPDLILKNAALTSATVSAGGSTKAAVFITNQGKAAAGSSSTGYYLSLDTLFNKSSDTYLSYSYSSALSAGETSAQSATLSIPSTQVPGKYYLLFVADYEFSVDETNEKNNVAYAAISITKNDVDLQIINPYSTPSEISPSSYFELTNYVKNSGQSIAGSNYTGYYLSKNETLDLDDILIGSSSLYSVSSNSSAYQDSDFSLQKGVEDGKYYLIFVADYLDFVSETNEDNNTSSIAITVGRPDLISSNITLGASSVEAGSDVRIYSFLKNMGTATSKSSYLGYYLSLDTTLTSTDKFLGYSSSEQIRTSEYDLLDKNMTIPSSTEAGKYYLILYADYENSNVEISEANNTSHVALTVLPPNIDLIISNAKSSSAKISTGEYVTISNTVKNVGKSTAYSSYTGYYVSKDTIFDSSLDTYLSSYYVYSLAGGGSQEQSQGYYIPSSLKSGNYYILIVADYSKNISEQNESNNVSALPLEITPPNVDLTISGEGVVENTTPGSYVYVSNTLNNIGTSTALSSNTGYYLSKDTTYDKSLDIYLGSAYSYSIYGGSSTYQSTSVYIPSSTKTGTYYLLFVANYDNGISELNVNNNVKFKNIKVSAPFIDLTISSISTVDSVKTAGSSLQVNNTLYNRGTSYSYSSYTGYYLSKDSLWDGSDVYLAYQSSYGMSAGSASYQEAYLTIPSKTTVGNYFVLAVADYTKIVEEENEQNNVRAIGVRIVEPYTDLSITFSFLSKAYLKPSESFDVYNDVVNGGTNDLKSINTSYYLSKDTIFDGDDTYLALSTLDYLRAGSVDYQFSTIMLPGNTALGTYYFLYVVDPKNLISESNEKNNIKYQTIVVSYDNSKGDLTIADAIFDSFSMKPGYSYEINSYLANVGSATIGSSTTGYFLSSNSTYDSLDVFIGSVFSNSVSAGDGSYLSSFIEIPYNTLMGRYYLLCVADYENKVGEMSESNNVFSSRVIIDVISGIEDEKVSDDITVYPNPAVDHLNVNLSGSNQEQATYRLISAVGVTVKSGTISKDKLSDDSISLAGLVKGLYTLVVNSGTKRYFKSITIQ